MLTTAFIKALDISGITRKLIATSGTIIINSTTPTSVEATSFIAMTDTVISTCSGIDVNGKAVDFMSSTYNWINIGAGVPIIAPTGFKITNITLTSGSIAIYR